MIRFRIGSQHKLFNWKVVFAWAIVFCAAIHGHAVLAKGVSQRYLTLYKEMLASNLKADEQLVTDMETVAQTLQEFAESEGHFPDAADVAAGLSLELSATLPKNPYVHDVPDVGKKPEEGADLLDEYVQQVEPSKRAQVVFDPSISQTMVERLSVNPRADWKASPGTVVAVTNGYDLCLIWGAGMDEQPVRETNGKVRLTVLRTNSN